MKYEITTKPAYKINDLWAYEATVTINGVTLDHVNVSAEKLEGTNEEYAFGDAQMQLLGQVTKAIADGTIKP